VEDYIRTHPAGRALDLGCGTGTSSIALAQAGWTVTGVDFAPRAIRIAKQRARKAGVVVDFRAGDVTRLRGLAGPFDLILDIGCFHGLPGNQRRRCLGNLDRLLAPDGTWLLYGFFKERAKSGPGLSEEEFEKILRPLRLYRRLDGTDKKNRPSAWFWLKKAENG
jgi:cyclopropane fatty-acyl-phospholipid synthase-like methyltransferase